MTIIEIQDYLPAFKKALDSIYTRLRSIPNTIKMPHYRNHRTRTVRALTDRMMHDVYIITIVHCIMPNDIFP